MLPPFPAGFLQELIDLLRWSFTIAEWNAKKQRWDKPPYSPHTGRKSSKTDPRTWGTVDQALDAMNRYGGQAVGICLDGSERIVAFDLDHCRNPETGEIQPWALEIIQCAESYAEVSPSGTGIRVFMHGIAPPGSGVVWKIDGHKVEVYSRDAWVTVSGHHVPGTPARLHERTGELELLWERWRPPTLAARAQSSSPRSVSLENKALIERR
jgi:primase-polymerase (primpol)-like protein